jgi:hypothetical protein
VSDTSRVGPQVPIPDMAATKTPGGAMDPGEHSFVQDAGVKNTVSAGLQ